MIQSENSECIETTGQQAVHSTGKLARSTAGKRTTEEFPQAANMDNCESDDDEDDSTISETEDDTAEQVHICVNMANRLEFTERKQKMWIVWPR